MNAESPRAHQLRKVREYMVARLQSIDYDRRWRTLTDISYSTGAPEASASARLRQLRKQGYTVDKMLGGDGLWLYRVTAPKAKGRK